MTSATQIDTEAAIDLTPGTGTDALKPPAASRRTVDATSPPGTWPRRIDVSAFGKQQLLDRFQRELDAIESAAPMLNSYQRIDPYIIETRQAGQTYLLIIYNVESELWYAWENCTDYSFTYLRDHKLIRPGDVIFDIGCNAGFTTCWYAMQTGQKGKVHAFDPFPWNALVTRYNAELNGLRNVTVHQVGIGAVDETIKLSLYDAKITSHQAPHVIDAQIHSLAHYRNLKPDVLKIDIEGSEYELSHTDFSAFEKLRFCFLELHPEFIAMRGQDPADCLRNFMRHNFELRRDPGNAETIYDGSNAAAPHGSYFMSRPLPKKNLTKKVFHSLPSPVQQTIRHVVAPFRIQPKVVQRLQAIILEREVMIREREAVTKDRERRIAELEAIIRQREVMIREREAVTKDRERQIAELKHSPDDSHADQEGAQAALAAPRIAQKPSSNPGLTRSTAERNALTDRILVALPKIEGWCTARKAVWLADLIAENNCRTVLEIGIFGGKSLIPIALAVQAQGPGGKVYGIEAWNGEVAVETPTNDDNDAWWRNLDFKVIKTGFYRNVLDNDLTDVINVLEMSSDAAYKCLNTLGLTEFDLIHVDGSHSEIQALRDVETWSPLIRAGGIIVMDDIGWPTVQPAREYAKSHFRVIEEVFETDGVAYGAYRINR